MLVARFMLAVKSEKRGEFLSAIGGLIDGTLRLPGCSACRLSADCSDAEGYFLISEWQTRPDFVAFTGSRELHVLCGMRGLLSADRTSSWTTCKNARRARCCICLVRYRVSN